MELEFHVNRLLFSFFSLFCFNDLLNFGSLIQLQPCNIKDVHFFSLYFFTLQTCRRQWKEVNTFSGMPDSSNQFFLIILLRFFWDVTVLSTAEAEGLASTIQVLYSCHLGIIFLLARFRIWVSVRGQRYQRKYQLISN